MKKVVTVLLSVLLIAVSLTACSDKGEVDPELCDSWYYGFEYTPSLMLYEDGTCVVKLFHGEDERYNNTGKWSVKDSKLKLTFGLRDEAVYEILKIADDIDEDGTGKRRIILQDSQGADPEHVMYNYCEREKRDETTAELLEKRQERREKEKVYKLDEGFSFSEGRAWVHCFKNGEGVWVCISKDGKALFGLKGVFQEVTPFSGGYAHLIQEDGTAVINAEGEITSTYAIDGKTKLKAYGDGYTLMESYVADFDSAVYEYRLYDYSGKEIEPFFFTSEKPVNDELYCGNGVFKSGDKFYCVDSEIWRDDESYQSPFVKLATARFHGDSEQMAMTDSREGGFLLMDSKGRLERKILPESYKEYAEIWMVGPLIDGICIMYDVSKGKTDIISYDIETDDSFVMGREYVDRLTDGFGKNTAYFDNGLTAMPLKGSDGKRYAVVFDTKWNMVFDPIPMKYYTQFSENRLIVYTDDDVEIYNEKGEKVFSLSEKIGKAERHELEAYQEGVACLKAPDGSETPVLYFDLNGNPAFDGIDFEEISVQNAPF